nr:reverse transcriptase domain-containing protein [Tanacetum cinerariifolium]
MEILYEHCFNRLRPEIKSQMVPATTSLTRFSGETTWPLGQLRLLVTIGDITHSTKAWMNFMIVKSLSPYNGIIGRPGLKAIQAVPSTVHGMLKFPTKEGIPSDMTGVPQSIAEHRLNIREGCPPDCYPLPKIDWKVESLCGYPFKCFLDAYKVYHQIQMAATDEEKTAFHTGQEVYCYTKMPFGLKNAGATYQRLMDKTQEEPWTLFTDGSSCVDGSGAGLILTNPDGVEFTYALRFQFAASNNEAEYEALIAGLRIATQMGQVPRTKNKKADALSKIASTSFAHLSKQVLVEVLETKSITGKEVTTVIEEEGPPWMTELVNYLKEGPRSVVAKAIRLGYFWPTMHKDAQDMIRKCSDCQIHRPVTRHPQQPLTLITAPWPFYKWGIDIAGPFPKGPGKVKFLIVAMDYFTKWIEAKAVATITGGQVKKFVWDNIVCRFGIPGEIISDNGKQFADNPFKDWCDKLNITQHFASVKHPQSNGLVERANRSLREGIKARLGEGNKNWVEELPHVLWAHRTMIKSSHGDTPFSLTYETEAVILAEIRMPTYRTTAELAAMSEARSKSKMMKYYNFRVRGVAFKPRDFVYHSNDASHAVAGGKL